MQRTLVSFADGSGNYAKALVRLKLSLSILNRFIFGRKELKSDYLEIKNYLDSNKKMFFRDHVNKEWYNLVVNKKSIGCTFFTDGWFIRVWEMNGYSETILIKNLDHIKEIIKHLQKYKTC